MIEEEFTESLEVHIGDRVLVIDAPRFTNVETGNIAYACRITENEYVFNHDTMTYHLTSGDAIEAGWEIVRKLKDNGNSGS